MSDLYIPDGTERIEKTEEKADCGTIETTSYFHAETGKLLRRDKNVKVDPSFLAQAFAGKV
jgi:hypothetical protein